MHDVRHNEYHPHEYDHYLKHGYTYNMVVSILDVSFFFFALSVVSATVVMPAFMLRLGASAALVALLPAVQVVGMRLPQIIVPFLVEGRIRQKPYILLMNVMQRTAWLFMAPLTFWLAIDHPGALLACFLVMFFVVNFFSGLAQPSWGDLIAKVIPQRRRGMFMGLNMMFGHGLGIVGGLIVAYIMNSEKIAFPLNYALLFLISSIIFWISFGFFSRTREPIIEVAARHESVSRYIASLRDVLRSNRRFVWYIVFACLFYGFVMGSGLFMAYAVSEFGPAEALLGRFVMASTIGVMITAPILAALFSWKSALLLSSPLPYSPTLLVNLAFSSMAMTHMSQDNTHKTISMV